MQRMEVIIRHMDDEDQVLSESSLSFQMVVASVDGIQVRRPQKRRFHELRTAKVVTAKGYRYVSGADASFLGYLLLLIRLCLPEGGFLTLLADGAYWIRQFFAECLCYRTVGM